MGRLRYIVAISLDSFIARIDSGHDCIIHDESIDFVALYARFDAFIMGRKTFETVESMGDDNPLRSKLKDQLAVVTSTLNPSSYPAITILGSLEQAREWVHEAKAKRERDIWLFGGGLLCGHLLRHRLVDTIELYTH